MTMMSQALEAEASVLDTANSQLLRDSFRSRVCRGGFWFLCEETVEQLQAEAHRLRYEAKLAREGEG